MRRHTVLATFGVFWLGCATSCQSILGFEDLSGGTAPDGGSTGGRDGTGGVKASGGATGSGGKGDGGAPGNGGSPGTGGSSSASEGKECVSADDCEDQLVCVYGRCRVACTDETGCAAGSVCLFNDAVGGGCRVVGEAACTAGKCDNAQLVCGLDDTCRVECSATKSCDSPTQICVSGSCVSTVGEDAVAFDCGGKAEGDVSCDGAKLQVCNVLSPGLATVDTCSSAGICLASVGSGKYDANAPPECASGCSPNTRFCSGATLHHCRQDGSGPVDAGVACATAELCAAAVATSSDTCPKPACAAGETRCSGGQTALDAESCNAGRTEFVASAHCADSPLQCNPTTAKCISLKVDATEVTSADYTAWLATNPSTSGQPTGCSFNTSFAPDAACAANAQCNGTAADCPITCVDWCDANAYCAAKGKRLCGKIGGGMVPYDEFADAGKSEWMNACSAAGQYVYTSGNAVPPTKPDACAYSGNSGGTPYPVGTRGACHSPAPGYTALKDLSGNVAEWEDSCQKVVTADGASGNDACRTRGGSYASPEGELRCANVPAVPLQRKGTSPSVGIRCCDD